ncbi:SPA2 [Candida metapsilosis]|uniref:SPA2 n=1 Tax=Candida metapsilosis TaxID=273372 RepID=A0A8H7ZJ51_9ASCO|nr:SPA2 [Candida metapsilosis]
MSEKDLAHHYKVLKQFLDISDDQHTRSKSTSSRAQRAREKLLKLSGAQFKELSTDVYDELKRRIDESRGEPDYLLPKSSFHPKRNQARQKLASLPQTRFKDLVADISYEIERRDLHIEQKDTHEPSRSLSSSHANNSPAPHERKPSQASSHLSHMTNGSHSHSHSRSASRALNAHPEEENKKLDTPPDRSEEHAVSNKSTVNPVAESSNQSIGIQQSTVIPTKANLTWSSDEEDNEKEKSEDVHEVSAKQSHLNGDHVGHRDLEFEKGKIFELEKELDAYKKQLGTVEEQKGALNEKLKSLQEDYDISVQQNKTLSEELEQLGQEKANWISKHETLSKALQDNDKSDEVEKLKSMNAALRLENQSLKNASPVNRSISSQSPRQSDIQPRASNSSVTAFLEKLEKIDIPTADMPSTLELKKQVKQWQRRYEDSRSKFIASEIKKTTLSKVELKSFISPQGLVSIKLVSDAQALLESFLVYISENWDVNVMFEKASKIAVVMNEIAAQGENQVPNSNEHSILLREAAAYALTATRYHATYRSLFPKFIVEKALGEMNCVLCDLVATSKLNENSTNLRKLEPEKKAEVSPSQMDYGVRPLKMANKLKSSHPNMINGTYYQTPPNKQHQKTPPQNIHRSPPQKSRTTPTNLEQSPPQRSESLPKSVEEPVKQVVSKDRAYGDDQQQSDRLNKHDTNDQKQERNASSSRGDHSFDNEHKDEVLKKPFTPSVTGRSDNVVPQTIERNTLPLSTRDINREPIVEKQQDRHFENTKTSTPVPSKMEKSPHVTSLGRKFAEAASDNERTSPSASKTTPTKKGHILDRVKQFERSPEEQARSSPPRFQRSPRSVESSDDEPRRLADPFTSKLQGHLEKPAEKIGRYDGDDGAVGRGRGILQSFKDRSAADSNTGTSHLNSNSESSSSHGKSKTPTSGETARRVGEFTPINHSFEDNDNAAGDREPSVRVKISSPKLAHESSSQDASDEDYEDENDVESEARQRQEYRKSMAAATFNVDLFDIEDPDNTLTQVLLYLEHQTVEVINTIQSLLGAIKKPNATKGDLRQKSKAITVVISQMCEATNTSMNQTRNAQLKEHGSWVVKSLEDCYHRMDILCKPAHDANEGQFADKNFKQRLAGISFDIAKCTKELVKTVEEASLKEDIAYLDARISHNEDLT